MNLNGIKNPDVRATVRAAVQRGWVVDLAGSGHVRLRHPSGAVVYTSGTTCRGRGDRNFKAAIARVERGVTPPEESEPHG